jgi:ubiquitin-conjugating enzyme E2 J2
LKERGELLSSEKSNGLLQSSSLESDNIAGGNHGLMGSTLVNLCVILGFAAFAYTVKCVLRAVENS